MKVHRITGKHLFLDETGAAIWLKEQSEKEIDTISARIVRGAKELGIEISPRVFHFKSETVFAIDFPCDLLYTACELLEWSVGDDADFSTVQKEFEEEKNLDWRALKNWASINDVPYFDDEDGVTLGLGKYSKTWSLDSLPELERLSPEIFAKIPIVYLTGTNGKTTSSRMLASILREAGYTVGMTSSDGVIVNNEWILKGDWTGPGAARQVLRHSKVDSAVLETARGGLMRRGLVYQGADAAGITNISNDHLGSWGIHDLEGMGIAKLTVALGVKEGGTLILNADSEFLVKAFKRLQPVIAATPIWFSSQKDADLCLRGRYIFSQKHGNIIDIHQIPLCLKGTAIYNAENAMVAVGLALSLQVSISDIQNGLRKLRPNPIDSRGRSNWLQYNGADIILDFAHNPDGVKRLIEMAKQWSAKRKFIVIGQAGDRDDELILDMAREAAKLDATRYYLKALPKHQYEREAFEVIDLLQKQLVEDGVSEELIVRFPDEMSAIRHMLSDASEGDLLLLLSHEELDAVLPFIEELGATWV